MNIDRYTDERNGATLSSGSGGALGLAVGVVVAQILSWLVFWLWGEGPARITWQVFSPLSALTLAVAGAHVFRNHWSANPKTALVISLMLVIGLVLFCFWLGFPWSGTES